MKKIIKVKPVTEIELQFEDGKIISLVMDVEALANSFELKDVIDDFIKEKSLTGVCANIIYIAGKSRNEGLTLEEARKIVAHLDPATIIEIVNEFNDSMGLSNNKEQKELQKQLMAEFLNGKARL